jgi:hypothetical protein
MIRETSMIGTNRDLKSMQRILDCRIIALKQLAGAAPEQNWISRRLAFLSRQRIAVCATLVNRRIEAARHIVDLSRWFNGNGALFGGTLNRSPAERRE